MLKCMFSAHASKLGGHEEQQLQPAIIYAADTRDMCPTSYATEANAGRRSPACYYLSLLDIQWQCAHQPSSQSRRLLPESHSFFY